MTSVYSDGAEEKDLADDGQGELMGRAAKQPNQQRQDWTTKYLPPTYTAVSSCYTFASWKVSTQSQAIKPSQDRLVATAKDENPPWQRFEATEAWQQPCFLSFSDLQIATVA